MNANFSSTRKNDNEPRQPDNEPPGVLLPLYRKEQGRLKYEPQVDTPGEPNHVSFKGQNLLLEVLVLSIGLFVVLCYATWKDQRSTDANELYRDTMVMRDFMLNQVLQVH